MIHPLRVRGQAFSHHEPALRTHLSTFGFIPAQSYFQTYFCGDTRFQCRKDTISREKRAKTGEFHS
jgi:hypothetical protein